MHIVKQLHRREPDAVHVSEKLADEARKWKEIPVRNKSRSERPAPSETARHVWFDRD